ncbi:MAG: CoA-binding protein [Bdellovibrionales bacterium]|nr:CoA-binding protein [Bdellovibrionales bacterium]
MEVVAVLGASSDTTRYSYKAMQLLKEYGHTPIPVHPREIEVLGYKVVSELKELVKQGKRIDTVTMYVNPALSTKYQQDLIDLNPKRVIFNPGSENPLLEKALGDKGIVVMEACTLVLLRTDQF